MPATAAAFEYADAFARNLGLVDAAQQARLRGARVAIAGLGGVGGAHVQAMARLGIGALSLPDPDVFEGAHPNPAPGFVGAANLNRQLGAAMDSVGEAKVEVLARTARGIDPLIDLRLFPAGI